MFAVVWFQSLYVWFACAGHGDPQHNSRGWFSVLLLMCYFSSRSTMRGALDFLKLHFGPAVLLSVSSTWSLVGFCNSFGTLIALYKLFSLYYLKGLEQLQWY